MFTIASLNYSTIFAPAFEKTTSGGCKKQTISTEAFGLGLGNNIAKY